MDEIGVLVAAGDVEPVEQRVVPLPRQRVPADMGIFRLGSRGARRRTSPAIQSKPGVTSCSWPLLAISCMPTQMPRKGLPSRRTALSSVSIMPGIAAIPSRQSRKAPTPGSTIRSALRTASGSAVTTMSGRASDKMAARSSAFDAERRLPEP